MKKTISSLTACLFAVVFIMTSCGPDHSKPEAVANAYTSAWAKADFKKMIKLSEENNQQSIFDRVAMLKADEEYEYYIFFIKSNEYIFTQEGEATSRGDNRVSVNFKVTSVEDREYILNSMVGLIKGEDGKWKVAFFQEPR